MKIKRKRNKQTICKGATLVEALVYLALFAMIFVVFIRLFWYVSENNRRAMYRIEMAESAMFVYQHLSDGFNSATGVNIDNCVFEQDSGVLSLVLGEESLTYMTVDEVLYVEDSVSAIAVTSNKYNVSRFYLERVLSSTDELIGVKVLFSISPEKQPDMSFKINTMYKLK